MNHRNLLGRMIGLALFALILAGCAGGAPVGPTVTSTPVIPTLTSTPIPPTATPTSIPLTPTPATRVGVALTDGGWQVTVENAHQETQLKETKWSLTGTTLSMETTTHIPKSGHTFLVVEVTFRNLDPSRRTEVSAEDITVINEDGDALSAIGGGSGENYCVNCPYTASTDGNKLSKGFVFMPEEDTIDQTYELQFQQLSPIPFSLEQETACAFTTEIRVEPDILPYACMAEGLPSLSGEGWLTFYREEETGISLGHVDANGSELMLVCSDVAFGDLQFAADGATLLLIYPQQGWPSLYLVEPQGTVYPLVNNGLEIKARFDPTGRWVFFVIERIGGTGKELHVFDREAVSTTLVQAGEQIIFDFLADGRLIVDYRETEDSDHQYYVGPADGTDLTLLNIPDEIPGNRSVSLDGQHLVYYDVDDFFDLHLFISDLDGGNAQELAQAEHLRLYGTLSPNNQSILIGIGEETNMGDRVEFHNLTTGESWIIGTGRDRADFGFSADSQWASVITTLGDQHTLYIIRTTDGSRREVNNAINAFFSPDSTQLAYTVRQSDGDPEMYVTSLDGEATQSLGPGVLSGWFPHGVVP